MRKKNKKNTRTKKRTVITTEINLWTGSVRNDHQRLSETVFLSLCKATAHIQEQMANVLFVNVH